MLSRIMPPVPPVPLDPSEPTEMTSVKCGTSERCSVHSGGGVYVRTRMCLFIEVSVTSHTINRFKVCSSVAFRHNVVQLPPLSSFQTFSLPQKETLYTLSSYFPSILLPLVPGNHRSALCLYGFTFYSFWMFCINGIIVWDPLHLSSST